MKNLSVCGIDCSVACVECNKAEELKDNPCHGCNSAKGKIYWVKFIDQEVCPIYKCVEDKKLEHCGKCEALPCDIWKNLKDPSMSDEAHLEGLKQRVELLKSL
jgi:hypothetical protein